MFNYFRGKTKEKNEWIPVTERLPKKLGEYLVTAHSGGMTYATVSTFFPEMKNDPTGPWLDCGVTAWMPLPEPYEVEE